MKESKVLSIRLKTELYEEFKSLCAENEKSVKTFLLECINLLVDAGKLTHTHASYEEGVL